MVMDTVLKTYIELVTKKTNEHYQHPNHTVHFHAIQKPLDIHQVKIHN